MKCIVATSCLALLLSATGAPAWAAGGGHPSPATSEDNCKKDLKLCGKGEGGDVDFAGYSGKPHGQGRPQGGRPGGGRPIPRPVSAPQPVPVEVTEYDYEPTCSSNSPDNGGALCGAALAICRTKGVIGFWVFTRVRNTRTGQVSGWHRVSPPPYVCLGAEEAAAVKVPAHVVVGQAIEDFDHVPVPVGAVQVRPPNARTLVNVGTHFFTTEGLQPQTLPPVSILGHQVTVTVTATNYDWSWGDGQSSGGGPGSEDEPIVHTYEQPGRYDVTVTITWTGTFTVQGDAGTYEVQGSTTTTSAPLPVTALTAGSELVDD